MAADVGAHPSYEIAGRSLSQIIPRLDAMMMVLKTCKGKVCTQPWRTLHPEGDVNDLKEALAPKYDDFYEVQPKMAFFSCEDAYYLEVENQEPVKSWAETEEDSRLGLTRQGEFNLAMHWQFFT